MNKIQCVLFDIGGVLVDWHMSWITSEISNRFQLDKKHVDEAFHKYLHELDCGKITEQDFWKKIGAYCSSKKLQNTSESLWDTYFRKNAIPNTELIQISQNIKEKNLALGVLSNIEKVTHCVVEDWNVLDNFDFKFFSYQIGFAKPDSKIYEHAIANMSFSADQVLFIDDKKENIAEAEKAGLIGLHYTGMQSLQNQLQSFDIVV